MFIKTSEDLLKYLNKLCGVIVDEGDKQAPVQKISKLELECKEDKE